MSSGERNREEWLGEQWSDGLTLRDKRFFLLSTNLQLAYSISRTILASINWSSEAKGRFKQEQMRAFRTRVADSLSGEVWWHQWWAWIFKSTQCSGWTVIHSVTQHVHIWVVSTCTLITCWYNLIYYQCNLENKSGPNKKVLLSHCPNEH